MELNNDSTPGTPDDRMNLSAQYNNLWQLDHQIGVSYSFTPGQTRAADENPALYDRPLIAARASITGCARRRERPAARP